MDGLRDSKAYVLWLHEQKREDWSKACVGENELILTIVVWPNVKTMKYAINNL